MRFSLLQKIIILWGFTGLLTMTYFSIDTKKISIEKDFILKEISEIKDINSGTYISINQISLLSREHRLLGEVQLGAYNSDCAVLESEYLKQLEENGWKKIKQKGKEYVLTKDGYIIQVIFPHSKELSILLVIKKENY